MDKTNKQHKCREREKEKDIIVYKIKIAFELQSRKQWFIFLLTECKTC